MSRTLQLESVTRQISYRDPILLFHDLVRKGESGLLLESAEVDSKRHLQSFLLVRSALRIACYGNMVQATALTPNGKRLLSVWADALDAEFQADDQATIHYAPPGNDLDEDQRLMAPSVMTPLRKLTECIQINSSLKEALFVGGLCSYDLVECYEPLPPVEDDGQAPNYVFHVAEQLIRLDHVANEGRLIGSFFYETDSVDDRSAFEEQIEQTRQRCETLSLLNLPPVAVNDQDAVPDRSDEEFCQVVDYLKTKIYSGEVFQIVPSRSFSTPCRSPLRAYQRLRELNPSPYMFFMQDVQFSLFGASPEMAIKYSAETGDVEICPIAGTRPRGKHADGTVNHDLDGRIELELRTDQKEMAEHLMLVDLARNDLARICEPGSRHIARLLKVDRYSHVMHLVSNVTGKLRSGLDGLHAYQACMNMGTLTGAPKVRAMQLIRDVEKRRRDSYGGGIGYFLGSGDMETCIVIRSAIVVDGTARVQAGAGVVYDSIPQSEANETRSKAAAVLNALRTAHQ